jgi:hypothetical protein
MNTADRVLCRLPQRIAPYAGRSPSEDSFCRVMLNDISATGFSFVAKSVPATNEIVFALDVGASPRLMLAKVVSQSRCAEGLFVDCEFIGKLVAECQEQC